jgi:dienelactone hydrolase
MFTKYPRYLREILSLCSLVILFSSFYNAGWAGTHNSNKDFTPPWQMSESDWSNPAEMERAWQGALVRIPLDKERFLKTTMSDLKGKPIPPRKKFPTVIYLHGCSGVWSGTIRRIDFLAENGFAVIAPVSFAREKYPKSCDEKKHRGSLYRGTLRMRQFDAGYAIKKAKTLSWVDANNVFLMGLSEGGITTATFSSNDPKASLNARVVEGWTCHAGWQEYKGINAPESEPVLTLVSLNDPWFQNRWTKGNCERYLNKSNGSKSVVYTSGSLSNKHELLENRQAQETVLEFLNRHIRKWD